MLLGTVPYLNAIPLIRGLDIDVRKAPPAALERLLNIGEIDLATAPVTTLFAHPEWRVIPGVAIGTKAAAGSVFLCTRTPEITWENIQSIYLDIESRTSNHLVQVLLACKYGRLLESIELVTPLPSPDVEGKLIIGDKALQECQSPAWSGHIYDLGQEWTEWTGLPFVFACWTTPHATVDTKLTEALQQAVSSNLASLSDWISEIPNFDAVRLQEYFTENLDYGFEEREQQGLMQFQRYLRELGLVDKPFELRFVNS